ncbi:MAG: hypothetical protein MZU91_07390 [Desulfosudis oleivorans]|nr:hypothetical protein [Desulfosudis oleivorans]
MFDRVARDYERIHDRSLPPGVHSSRLHPPAGGQRVSRWISDGLGGQERCCLDFGCGNGRMLNSLLESGALRRRAEQGRLRLFGFDTSVESDPRGPRPGGRRPRLPGERPGGSCPRRSGSIS